MGFFGDTGFSTLQDMAIAFSRDKSDIMPSTFPTPFKI